MTYYSVVVSDHPSDEYKTCRFKGSIKHLAVPASDEDEAEQKARDAGFTVLSPCRPYPCSPQDPRINQIL